MNFRYKLLKKIAKKCNRRAEKIANKGMIQYDRESDYTFGKGATLVYNLFKSDDVHITRLYVKNVPTKEAYYDEVIERAKEKGIPMIVDEHPVYDSDKGYGFCVVAEVEKPKDRIVPGNHVVLVDPSIVRNAGAVMRTALAFDIKDMAIINTEKNMDFESPEVVRTSMGARLMLRVEVFSSIEEYRERFPENNLYAFMLRNAKNLSEIKAEAPYSLIFGNETLGLPDEYASFCNAVFIEQSDMVDSINLSNAASIGLYEFKRMYFYGE